MTTDRDEAVPDLSETGAPVVTPAMIEVGVSALYESGAIENPILENDRALVRVIFLQMCRTGLYPFR